MDFNSQSNYTVNFIHLFQMKTESIEELAQGIRNGNRVLLSKAITLAESSLSEHQKKAHLLIQELMPLTGKSKRIAVTGVPGVGKSTFIEFFGQLLTSKGFKVAVLAIDPSSSLSRGSILGDKTRMEDLARNSDAYIRPSATRGFLGGIASRTFEAMLLCEAAGFDVVLIETVGVGQSEILVNDMTDFFLFLQIPGAGDDLQGIKRGIMEMSDLIFVNKTDDFGLEKSKDVKVTLARSLQFLPQKDSGWKRKVLLGSGLTGKGLEEVWESVLDYFNKTKANGFLEKRREDQHKLRVTEYIKEQVTNHAMELYKKSTESSKNGKVDNPYLIAEKWIRENLKFNQ